MTEPNAELGDREFRPISIGGKLWPIPKLGWRQLEPMQEALDPLVKAIITDQTPMAELTREQVGQVAQIVYLGMTRAHPGLTRDEFDEMETSRAELIDAFFTVALVAYGHMKAVAPAAPPAEHPAAAA
jgi:hypothetical protein